MYATHWTLGNEAKQALGVTDEVQEPESTTITQECPQSLPNTSINYGSLFAEEDLLLQSDCKDVCSSNNGVWALSGEQAEPGVGQATSAPVPDIRQKMPPFAHTAALAGKPG
jgi:hypothetical protein